MRMTQVRPDTGSAAPRREMDFGCAEKILGGCGAAVALSGGSHARGDRGRLKKVVVRSETREDARERKLQWVLEVVLWEKSWVLG